jgi:hypothetical protein
MRFAFVVLPLVAAAALCTQSAQAGPVSPDRAVTPWIEVTLDEIAAHRIDPPHASRVLATLSVAMQRAVARTRTGASAGAVVDGAASTVLAYFFPDRRGHFRDLANRSVHAAPRSGPGGGFALGRRAGEELIARAESDGADAPFTGTIPVGPEFWVPTPPGFLPPLLPRWGRVLPWNIDDPVALRPPRPPRPSEPVFEAEVREVYDVSRTLTPEQRAIALFWADGPGTFTPPGHWNEIALGLVRTHGLDTAPGGARLRRPEHGPGRRLHLHLGRQVRVLVAAADHGHPARDRPELESRDHNAAVPFVRVRAFGNVRSRSDGALGLLSGRGYAASCTGERGGAVTPLRGDPLPHRQRGRPRTRHLRREGGARGLAKLASAAADVRRGARRTASERPSLVLVPLGQTEDR